MKKNCFSYFFISNIITYLMGIRCLFIYLRTKIWIVCNQNYIICKMYGQTKLFTAILFYLSTDECPGTILNTVKLGYNEQLGTGQICSL